MLDYSEDALRQIQLDRLLNRNKYYDVVKYFLLSLGEIGEIADKISDLILFHRRVQENAEKRYL